MLFNIWKINKNSFIYTYVQYVTYDNHDYTPMRGNRSNMRFTIKVLMKLLKIIELWYSKFNDKIYNIFNEYATCIIKLSTWIIDKCKAKMLQCFNKVIFFLVCEIDLRKKEILRWFFFLLMLKLDVKKVMWLLQSQETNVKWNKDT